jgi:hypothetical protein
MPFDSSQGKRCPIVLEPPAGDPLSFARSLLRPASTPTVSPMVTAERFLDTLPGVV